MKPRDIGRVFLLVSFLFSIGLAEDLLVGPGQTYSTIQGAIDAALAGDSIIVSEGTYAENINFHGKNITLASTDPGNWSVVAQTIIQGDGTHSVVAFAGTEGVTCSLTGFTITGGDNTFTTIGGGGIFGNGSTATISCCTITGNAARYGGGLGSCNGLIDSCLIKGNTATDYGGGLAGCHGTISNCLVVENTANVYGGGFNNCDGDIINCTVARNVALDDDEPSQCGGGLNMCDGTVTNSIIWLNTGWQVANSTAVVSYTLWGGDAEPNNINADPSFVFDDDYHLAPDSPCIDAGTDSPPGGLAGTDVEGNARLMDGDSDEEAIVDIGAYEFDGQVAYVAISPRQFDFAAMAGAAGSTGKALSIRNGGGGTLAWQVDESCGWLATDVLAGESTGEIDDVILTVDASGLGEGVYSCELSVFDENAANSPRVVPVTLYVLPVLSLVVPDDYGSIQAAIDSAVTGDTVAVLPGRYLENINFNGKDITVSSAASDDASIVASTIIDGGGSGSVVTFENGETSSAVLRGFTITGGSGTQDEDVFWGAGIYCRFASPTITGNVIVGNHGPSGADATYGFGGGIGCQYSNAMITRNTITGNDAYAGGGILATGSQIQIRDNMICNNAAGEGGGIFMYGGQLVNNTVVSNSASSGGNICVVTYYDDCLITNNIIAGAPNGQGLYLSEDEGDYVLSCNNCWDNADGNYSGILDQTGINGNISEDPLFVDAAAGDYHLRGDSPCIAAGDPGFAPIAGETDIDGEERVFAMRVDIGADEYVGYLRPVAYAGPDQFLDEVQPVTLDGSGSFFYDMQGVRSFRWTQTAGATVTLDDSSAMQPTFVPTVRDEYVFELAVSEDEVWWSPTDEVLIVVGNRAPIADAGHDRGYCLGAEVSLDGSGSYDRDPGDVLSYAWEQTAGPEVVLEGADTVTPSFSCAQMGTYVFELVVNDGELNSESSTVKVKAVEMVVTEEMLDLSGLGTYAHYGDISGDIAIYGVGSACDVTWAAKYKNLASDRVMTFSENLIQPKMDGDLIVWFKYGDGWGNPWYHEPSNCSVFVRSLSTGRRKTLRSWSWSESYGHPVICGTKVIWMEHLGLDPNPVGSGEANNWWNTPFNVCGADISDWDNPTYFTIAENVGTHDPYPCHSYGGDFDDVIDISGNVVVWEGDGDIYGADISDLENIIVFTICDDAGKQYDPAISGHIVVWTDERDDDGDIYGADISDRQAIEPFMVVQASGEQSQPAIDGPVIVYRDGGSNGEIKVSHVMRGNTVLAIPLAQALGSGVGPAIDGDIIVWQSSNYGQARGVSLNVCYAVTDGPVVNTTTGRSNDFIQHAIDFAVDGDEIIVAPITYYENIKFKGKRVRLASAHPDDESVVAQTIIQGDGGRSVVAFAGTENATCVLTGFTITGGDNAYSTIGGGGIFGNGCKATISRCTITGNAAMYGGGVGSCNGLIDSCVIKGNTATNYGGGLAGCHGTITNCLVVENTANEHGGGFNNCDGDIVNCTIARNVALDDDVPSQCGGGLNMCDGSITNCIIWLNSSSQVTDSTASVSYTVWGGYSEPGNISADPLFADVENSDYHLQSQAGRWSQTSQAWVCDGQTSPCVDAGNPASDWKGELWPHGKRTNMGAHGGTPQASWSNATVGNVADVNRDGTVDLIDLSLVTSEWMTTNLLLPENLDCLGAVDVEDLSLMANEWLWQEP